MVSKNTITTLFKFDSDRGLKKIKADMAEVDGSINKAKTGVKGLWAEFKNNRIAQAAVAGMVVKLGTDAVNAASSLEESINAVNVTYGESADAVRELGAESVDSYGLSERAFNQMSVALSGFAEQVAGDGGDVAGTLDEMATRIADFGSIHELTSEDAMQKFQSALAGEAESLRRYGIDVSAAAVKTYAYANGVAEAGSELTETQKVQARYGLIMQETAQWAGDFEETSGSLANTQKRLRGEIENLQAELGSTLIPAVTDATQTLVQMAEVTGDVVEQIKLAGGSVPPEFKRIADAAQALSLPMLAIKGPLDAAGWALDKVGLSAEESAFSIDAAVKSYWQQKYAVEESAKAQHEAEDAAIQNTEAMRDQAKAANNNADRLVELEQRQEEVERAQERAEQAAEDYNRSLEDQRRRIEDLNNANMSALGTDIRLREAKRRTSDAYAEFVEVSKEAEAGTREYEEAADAALTAMLGQAEAATEYRIAQMEANGETVTAAEKAQIMEEELGNLALMLGPDSPLLANIQNYIDQLNNIPRNVSTTISVGGRTVSVGGGGGNVGGVGFSGTRASGGPVHSGQTYLVGEEGPELLHMGSGHSGSIIPNDKIGGGGGVTVNIMGGYVDDRTIAELERRLDQWRKGVR